jgi:pSer/pThr/pTyr-binding forkhead associated (FHA) protein
MTLACPQCKSPVAREGQRFCYRCGNDLREYYEALNIHPQDSQAAPKEVASNGGDMSITGQTRVKATENIPRAMDTLSVDPIITTDAMQAEGELEYKALLRILLPSGDVFDREMQRAEAQIGKGPRNDIVIADPAVSSSHALIRAEEGVYTITDLGSRNGTFVNSERISEPQKLNHGDVIGIGLSKITFRLKDHSETGAINLTEVLARPASQGPPPLTEDSLAQALINEGLATRNDVERLRGADARGRRLARALLDERLVSEDSLLDLMSRVFRLPITELSAIEIDEAPAIRFSSSIAREHHVFAFNEADGRLKLAVTDPTDTAAVEKVEKETGLPVDLHLANWTRISEQIEAFYGPKLIGVLPTGEKLRYMINQAEIEIGKASHNNIVIADPTVSNTHAILMVRDGGYSIVDLGSRNGTFVNGERLGTHSHTLRHGDAIQLGQTVLTFRNSGETTENVTATLSAEALEEIRRRAGIEAGTPASPRSNTDERERKRVPTSESSATPAVQPPTEQPPAAPLIEQQSPAVAMAPAAELSTPPLTEEQADEKKKKKKKKEGDRMKAAYVSAASRIVAQVLAVVLTVGLSLYIVNRSMSPSQPAPDNTNSKPKKERVASPGAGIPFAGGVFEASGVAQVPNTDGVYFVDDGKPGQIFWMQLDQTGRQVGDIKPIDYGYQIADHEGIVYGGSFFYVVGSNSQPEKGERNALARFAFDAATQTVNGPAEVITDLRGFLLENVPELKDVKDKPGNAGGLNIEGIAWDVTNDRLLLGLRSPVANGQSLIVPIKLRDPRGAFSRDNLQPPGAAIPLSLGGLGIRDIYYDTRTNSYLIVAGSPVTGGSPITSLWEWNGDTDQANPESSPRELTKLDPVMKPEGVTRVRIGGRDFVFIVGDGSSYMKVDLIEP